MSRLDSSQGAARIPIRLFCDARIRMLIHPEQFCELEIVRLLCDSHRR